MLLMHCLIPVLVPFQSCLLILHLIFSKIHAPGVYSTKLHVEMGISQRVVEYTYISCTLHVTVETSTPYTPSSVRKVQSLSM